MVIVYTLIVSCSQSCVYIFGFLSACSTFEGGLMQGKLVAGDLLLLVTNYSSPFQVV